MQKRRQEGTGLQMSAQESTCLHMNAQESTSLQMRAKECRGLQMSAQERTGGPIGNNCTSACWYVSLVFLLEKEEKLFYFFTYF